MVEDGLGLGKLQVRFRDGPDRLLAKENDALTGPGRGRRRARLIQISVASWLFHRKRSYNSHRLYYVIFGK